MNYWKTLEMYSMSPMAMNSVWWHTAEPIGRRRRWIVNGTTCLHASVAPIDIKRNWWHVSVGSFSRHIRSILCTALVRHLAHHWIPLKWSSISVWQIPSTRGNLLWECSKNRRKKMSQPRSNRIMRTTHWNLHVKMFWTPELYRFPLMHWTWPMTERLCCKMFPPYSVGFLHP